MSRTSGSGGVAVGEEGILWRPCRRGADPAAERSCSGGGLVREEDLTRAATAPEDVHLGRDPEQETAGDEIHPTTETLAGGSDAGDHMRRGKANQRGGEERAQREEAVGRLGDAGGWRNRAGSSAVGGCGSEEWCRGEGEMSERGVAGERDGWVGAPPEVGGKQRGEGEATGRRWVGGSGDVGDEGRDGIGVGGR